MSIRWLPVLNSMIVGLFVLPGWNLALAQESLEETKPANAADTADGTGAEALPYDEIEAVVTKYQELFNKRDGEAFSGLWTSEPVYVDQASGESHRGRNAVLGLFSHVFEAPAAAPTLGLQVEAIEFVSPMVALVRGQAVVRIEEAEPTLSAFSSVFVRHGDAWLLDRVTEEVLETQANSHYEQLQPLSWLIGEWVDAEGKFRLEMTCDWTTNQNFISRKFRAITEEGVVLSGLQIIGWDPKKQEIRSWLFDSEGGFVNGVWSQREDHWTVQSVATLADGSQASFTSVFTPIDEDSYRWRKVNQVIDGELLPNVEEVVVLRN